MSRRKKWQPTTFYPGNAKGRRKLRRYLHRSFLLSLKTDDAFRAPFSIVVDFENGRSWDALAAREPFNAFSPRELRELYLAPCVQAVLPSYFLQESQALAMQREMNAKLEAEMTKLGFVKVAQV